MRRSMVCWTAAFVFLLLPALVISTSCGDDEDTSTPAANVGDLEISGAFARAIMDNAAVYFTVENSGDAADALVGVSTDAAGMAGLHRTVIEGTTSRMEPVEEIEVPAGGEAILEPGGYHVMLRELNKPLQEGDEIKMTLTFEQAGAVTLPVTVVPFVEPDG